MYKKNLILTFLFLSFANPGFGKMYDLSRQEIASKISTILNGFDSLQKLPKTGQSCLSSGKNCSKILQELESATKLALLSAEDLFKQFPSSDPTDSNFRDFKEFYVNREEIIENKEVCLEETQELMSRTNSNKAFSAYTNLRRVNNEGHATMDRSLIICRSVNY
jgi:hypothetical protein